MSTISYALRSVAAATSVMLAMATPGWSADQSVHAAGPASWTNDLSPIPAEDWSYERAAHLLERAGFGGTPAEIQRLADMTPAQAVRYLVHFQDVDNSQLKPFEHSGIHDSGIEPFPVSRPATTDEARDKGEALGVKVKTGGNRPMQPVVNKFFYWLRASRLETNRAAYWWANRMLTTNHPLEEKMALFWHGHFATNEEKVRDYRKMLLQLDLFYRDGTGNFRDLVIGVAQDPAMLTFLDAGANVKGAPNENFAREIMELFTMGVGNYTEKDIREAARAFTGWNYVDLTFVVNKDKHDDTDKTVLGHTGPYDGVAVIDIILQQPVTAEYIAGKIYRFFVRQDDMDRLALREACQIEDGRFVETDLPPQAVDCHTRCDGGSPVVDRNGQSVGEDVEIRVVEGVVQAARVGTRSGPVEGHPEPALGVAHGGRIRRGDGQAVEETGRRQREVGLDHDAVPARRRGTCLRHRWRHSHQGKHCNRPHHFLPNSFSMSPWASLIHVGRP